MFSESLLSLQVRVRKVVLIEGIGIWISFVVILMREIDF
jgi:hypothetical protein